MTKYNVLSFQGHSFKYCRSIGSLELIISNIQIIHHWVDSTQICVKLAEGNQPLPILKIVTDT